jgi:hypothetical protein
MEEPSSHGVDKSGNFDDHSGCKPTTADEGGINNDDPPPIPSASSSIQLTDRSLGESRYDHKPPNASSINHDVDITLKAHTLTVDAVTTELKTNTE